VDFLPGLVSPRVGVLVTELGQQTVCTFLLSCHLFSCIIYVCYHVFLVLEHRIEHLKTSVLEFQ